MYTDQQATIMRRQRIWADLTFLEKVMLRCESVFGTIPAYWRRAHGLLWRDLKAVSKPSSAQKLFGQVCRLTINGSEVEARIGKVLSDHEPITKTHVVHAMRNLGKAEGEEVPVGQESKPMSDLGYPTGGWTRLVKR